jgi:glycine oxidase
MQLTKKQKLAWKKCLSSSSSKGASSIVKSKVGDSITELNIAIIGGGLVGRLLAWRLASDHMQHTDQSRTDSELDNGITPNSNIHVFEKGSLHPSSSKRDKAAAFTAAAMISPMSELVASELEIYQLGQQSLTLWPTWLDQLGCKQHFHQQGSLVLAHPNDLAELKQFQRDLSYKLNQQASQDEADNLEIVSNRSQLATIEPSLNPHFQTGLLLPSEAHIDHDEVLNRLVITAKEFGVTFHENTELDPYDGSLKDFDIIYDCRGYGLKSGLKSGSMPESKTNFRGVRGEVIRIECKEVTLKRPIRLMHPRYKLYIVPKPNHQFVIGATEIESEDRSTVSLRSSMELMSALYAINSAFAEARIIHQETNLRPAYLDNLPRIEQEQSPFNKPIVRINGLYRHGYLIGPALVEKAKAFANIAAVSTTEEPVL